MSFRDLVRGSALIFLGSLIGMGSSFVLRFVTARTYTPDQYGIIILGITLVNFLSLIALIGLPQGFARNTAKYDDARDTEYIAFLISILLSVLLVSVVVGLPDQIFGLFDINDRRKIIVFFVLSLPFLVLIKLIVGYFRGRQYVLGRVISENIFSQGFTAIGIVLISYQNLDYSFIALFWLVSMVASSFVSIALMSSKFSLNFNVLSPEVNFGQVKKLIAFSIPLMLTDATWKIMQQSDNFIISYYIGPTSVGYYDAAFTLSRVLELAPATFGFLLLPMMTQMYESDNDTKMRSIYTFSSKWMAFMTIPALIVGIFLNEEVIQFVFGNQYISAAPALPIIMFGLFTHALMGVNKAGLVAVGESGTVLRGALVSSIINIILNILLIPIFGIYGAALSSALSYVILNIYFAIALYLKTGIFPQEKNPISTIILSIIVLSIIGHVVVSTMQPEIFAFIVLPVHILVIILNGSVGKEDIDKITNL